MRFLLHWIACIVAAFFVNAHTLIAQENDYCINDAVENQYLSNHLNDAHRIQQMNQAIAQATEQLWERRDAGLLPRDADEADVITLPIVVHIMHPAAQVVGVGSNISDQQVYSAIQHLNQAFRNYLAYDPTAGVDTQIEFCLASRTPTGNYTNGIVRYAAYNAVDLAPTGNALGMKTATAWDQERYINIWVVGSIAKSDEGITNIAGNATYAYQHGEINDGVICRFDYFGTNPDNSKVVAHELGHYLNLYHTFQGGCNNTACLSQGDYVCDTPPDALSSGDCNSINSCSTDDDDSHTYNPLRPTAIGGIGDQNDLIENYMDYSVRACQNMFTLGQKDRMRQSLLLYRSSLMNSNACQSVYANDAGISGVVQPANFACNSGSPTVLLRNYGTQNLNSVVIRYQLDNGTVFSQNWSGVLLPNATVSVGLGAVYAYSPNSHVLTAYTEQPNAASDANPNNDRATEQFAYIGVQAMPFNDDFEAVTLSSKWLVLNPDNQVGFEKNAVPANCTNNGSQALRLNYRSYAVNGEPDYIFTKINLSDYISANLRFQVAYSRYSATISDRLKVVVSTDCGESFQTLYDKAGSNLATVNSLATTAWIPASCAEWRTENINLSDYLGSELIIGWVGECRMGNNIYIDNVNIDGTTQSTCTGIVSATASSITDQHATISWTNTDPQMGGFTLRYRATSANDWTYASGITLTNYTINSLQQNTLYEVQIRTNCTDGGQSGYSNSLYFTTTYVACQIPYDIDVTDTDSNEATVSWSSIPNAAIYQVMYYPVGNPAAAVSFNALESSVYLNSLTENVSYQVNVTTVCANGALATAPISTTFLTLPSCDLPSNFILSATTSNSAIFSWNTVSDAISYVLEYKPASSSVWVNSVSVNGGATGVTLNSLLPDVVYQARLRSYCMGAAGVSNYSSVINFQLAAPCTVPSTWLGAASSSSLTLNLAANSVTTNQFRLIYKPKGSTAPWDTIVTANTSIILSDLLPCQEYLVRIQGICAGNNSSAFSSSATYTTFNSDGYCCSRGNSSSYHWIRKVQIASYINQSNNNGGYADFTFAPVSVTQGNTYNLKLTKGIKKKGSDILYWGVWVDYNHNNFFDDDEQVVNADEYGGGLVIGGDINTFVTNISIPTTTALGNTRMRVVLRYANQPEECGVFSFGETEEYTLNISQPANSGDKTDLLHTAVSLQTNVQPNPAQHIVTFYYQQAQPQPLHWYLYDMAGSIVYEQHISDAATQGSLTSDISHLPKGIYCLTVANKEEYKTQKLVVLR